MTTRWSNVYTYIPLTVMIKLLQGLFCTKLRISPPKQCPPTEDRLLAPVPSFLSPAELFSAHNRWQPEQEPAMLRRVKSSKLPAALPTSHEQTWYCGTACHHPLPAPPNTHIFLTKGSSLSSSTSEIPKPYCSSVLLLLYCRKQQGKMFVLHQRFHLWIENRFQGWHFQHIYCFKDH